MKNLCQKLGKLTVLLLATSFLFACANTQPICSKNNLSILIIGENSAINSVHYNGQVFNRVSATLASNLGGKGYRTITSDQLIQNYPEYFQRETIEHKDKTLIDLVRSLKGPQVDVIAVVSITAQTEEKEFHTNITSGMDVRLLDVKAGKKISAFAIDSEQKTSIRPNCKDQCLQQAIVDNARDITLEVAVVTKEKLACAGRSNAGFDNSAGGFSTSYSIVLDGFTTAEAHQLEGYLEDFSGYENHRVTYAGARRAEYWYTTTMKSAVLNRNIYQALELMDTRGLVQFSGNTYTVKKISLRGKQSTSKPINKNDW
jgi:hypothetical protein